MLVVKKERRMKYIIKNGKLEITLASLGAEITSIKDKNGNEYLWQGDEKFWAGQAPNLFPYIGRMENGKYSYKGKEYEMPKHGFLRKTELEVVEKSDTFIKFFMTDTDATREIYPFEFKIEISYNLVANRLETIYKVSNRGENVMYFGVGGHPAFNVPFAGDTAKFDDYSLTFSKECKPKQVMLSKECFCTTERKEFPLIDDTKLQLHARLFDNDAVILQEMDRTVVLTSPSTDKEVIVSFPDFGYIGFWNSAQDTTPFVCIEPWTTLPATENVKTDFEKQSDLQKLQKWEEKEFKFCIKIRA